MKTIDLSKVEMTNIDGSTRIEDVSKSLAQVIFQRTQVIPEHNFALELYKNPVVELTEEKKKFIQDYVKRYFVAFAQLAIEKLLKD